ncbi:class I SAM-dependent methyltransferase [Kribbella sandramycini]|uniref:SAM-dependent methyltransferase n=1 Tax=Kribbella sandramycini TaxID=60450 RepID=A0A7Y4KY31_9ACTN|nr:class I SAM-dependent methyltransferase [Kribbella sandramycini]MBB6569379.1 SAM-dependent methyltransferase [Kribbella sandramycini]NOL40783.1 class I SAM-dependent methyltransferase [Kribbella sandramycini]
MQGAELYDDPEFLAGYQELRRAKLGLNDELEIPALAALLPAASGLRVLDLGCGEGGLARRLADDGASDVLAVDASASMLANAVRHPRVRYLRADLACLDLQEEFDLVVSSLALHYVADFDGLVARIARRLTPGGSFVFSVEHPVITAPHSAGGFDSYADEGPRQRTWFATDVLKHHRTIATILTTLRRHGFSLTAVAEPQPTPAQARQYPHLAIHRDRPPLLLVAAEARR